jgi:uncharacterized protein (DUF169 family)
MTILQTEAHPVGVRLEYNDSLPLAARPLRNHRYCQALLRARRGENVVLEGAQLACPAAASAFGFRALPEELKSGRGLVGFGIVEEPSVGHDMFQGMPRLPYGRLHFIHPFPLDTAEYVPDVVILEDEVEKLMWVALALVHSIGGKRIQSSTAVLQATCVDCTILPFLEQRPNLSYGCYGCREATDLQSNESALGFPVVMLPGVSKHLHFLSQKAMPRSREKRPYAVLLDRNADDDK